MARPRRCRKICTEPAYDSFKPEGISVGEEITMTVDEYEVIRLVDLEKYTHEQCAERMGISRTTVTEIYESARYKLFYPQLGVKLCSMAGGGVQKIYMVLLREPSRRDRSGSDLFHLRDGFEIKMNFDRNVSCFIFVNALMHDDFFD